MEPHSIEALKTALRYEPETGQFYWRVGNRRWIGKVAGTRGSQYVHIAYEGRRYLAHRLAWAFLNGRWPTAQIDHRDLDGRNNRSTNLRDATRRQNQQNRRRHKNNTSGVKGVSWHRKNRNWRVRIKVAQKYLHVGSFASKEVAAQAYADAAQRYFGEFARTA
jgi:hypothetical protein